MATAFADAWYAQNPCDSERYTTGVKMQLAALLLAVPIVIGAHPPPENNLVYEIFVRSLADNDALGISTASRRSSPTIAGSAARSTCPRTD